MADKSKSRSRGKDSSLKGQLLIAMPTMTDKRFRRAVIYMCRHSSEGAMGIIVNQRVKELGFAEMLRQLNIIDEDQAEELPVELLDKAVHIGGPVSTERGFVLHTNDYVVENRR